jgi:hypothetical protein
MRVVLNEPSPCLKLKGRKGNCSCNKSQTHTLDNGQVINSTNVEARDKWYNFGIIIAEKIEKVGDFDSNYAYLCRKKCCLKKRHHCRILATNRPK